MAKGRKTADRQKATPNKATALTQMHTWRELHALYALGDVPANIEPRYNIAPTDDIDIIIEADGERRIRRARWGLVPYWWDKDLKDLPSTFNARAETVAERPTFKSAFRTRRCIVPASGFYEWTGPKGDRQPWYITGKDGQPLSLAGLWETWREPESGEALLSATIIVCNANEFMKRLHHRMPVVLAQSNVGDWLARARSDLPVPAQGDLLNAWPVTQRMNSSRYRQADAIEAVG